MTELKPRKKYEPIEYSVVAEIEDVKETRTSIRPDKQYQPRDPYYYKVFLKSANPPEYRIINVWKSSLEGDKDGPAEKIGEMFDKKTFRQFDGRRINFIFKKYQKGINLTKGQIL